MCQFGGLVPRLSPQRRGEPRNEATNYSKPLGNFLLFNFHYNRIVYIESHVYTKLNLHKIELSESR